MKRSRVMFAVMFVSASIVILAAGEKPALAQGIPTAVLPFQGRNPVVANADATNTDAAKKAKGGKTQNIEVQAARNTVEVDPVAPGNGIAIRQEGVGVTINASDARGTDSTLGREKDIATTVTDLLSVKLLESESVLLVERQELERILDELKLSRAGVVSPAEATQLGRLTGAQLLITGSVVRIDNDLYLIAKVIGTETSRISGASVKGPANSDLGELVDKLAASLEATLAAKARTLLPKMETETDWLAGVKKQLEGKKLPTVVVNMESKNGKLDVAAVAEWNRLLKELGFEVLAWDHPNAKRADLEIVGSANSEFAYRRGDWVASRCRIDLQIRSQADGKVVASDSETCMVFDLSEQTAGRMGLQDALRRLAGRVVTKLAPE